MPSKVVDLGKKPDVYDEKAAKVSKPYYPTLMIADVPELDDLPDGEFTFQCNGKIVRHTEEEGADGNSHCSCTIEVYTLEPIKSSKTKGVDLGSALDEIQAKKVEDDDEDGE